MSMLKVPISIGIAVYLDYVALEHLYAMGEASLRELRNNFVD